jgi:hypothetical protein
MDLLKVEFKIKDLGDIKEFLRWEIDWNQGNGEMKITQKKLIQELLDKTNMQDANPCTTPIGSNQEIGQGEVLSEVEKKELKVRNIVGSLQYLVMSTRPDLAFVVNQLARAQEKFTTGDYQILKRALRYLAGTKDVGLVYRGNKNIQAYGYADANFATCSDRKSITGYVFKIGDCTVTWKSKKQATVAKSTVEAEYTALSLAASEGLWLKNLLEEMGITQEPITIFEDNTGCIALATKAIVKSKVKHIDIAQHFIREKIDNGLLQVKYVPTQDQAADGLTKALPREKFQEQLNAFGMSSQLGGRVRNDGTKLIRQQSNQLVRT